jgi:deazaflavin-dependent oxidoreductase (nitroreductase family)
MEDTMVTDLLELADDDFCYLTTTGRVTGRAHTIEIWFAIDGTTLYMLSGGGNRADWIKNALRTPDVRIRIRETHFRGKARLIDDPAEDATARRIVVQKYQPTYESELDTWGRTSLPLAVDIEVEVAS